MPPKSHTNPSTPHRLIQGLCIDWKCSIITLHSSSKSANASMTNTAAMVELVKAIEHWKANKSVLSNPPLQPPKHITFWTTIPLYTSAPPPVSPIPRQSARCTTEQILALNTLLTSAYSIVIGHTLEQIGRGWTTYTIRTFLGKEKPVCPRNILTPNTQAYAPNNCFTATVRRSHYHMWHIAW